MVPEALRQSRQATGPPLVGADEKKVVVILGAETCDLSERIVRIVLESESLAVVAVERP